MRQVRAIEAARRILRERGTALPVDVTAIADGCGVTVIEHDLEDTVSGVLVIRDGRGIIAVNEAHHPNRQRFSVAHELGHYLLHCDAGSVFIDASPVFFRDETSSEGSDRQEIEANAFAAELLMPEEDIRRVIGNKPLDAFDEPGVRRLAARFGVSAQALTIRLTKLGLVAV